MTGHWTPMFDRPRKTFRVEAPIGEEERRLVFGTIRRELTRDDWHIQRWYVIWPGGFHDGRVFWIFDCAHQENRWGFATRPIHELEARLAAIGPHGDGCTGRPAVSIGSLTTGVQAEEETSGLDEQQLILMRSKVIEQLAAHDRRGRFTSREHLALCRKLLAIYDAKSLLDRGKP